LTLILYASLLPVISTSPESFHSACLLTQLILLLMLYPLLLRTLNRRLDLRLLPYFVLYSAPALIIASYTSAVWAVVTAEVALLSTAAALWTASNRITQKSTTLLWSLLLSLLFLPLILGETAETFYGGTPLRFLSPIAYILSPFHGEAGVALWGGVLIWIPSLVILVRKREEYGRTPS